MGGISFPPNIFIFVWFRVFRGGHNRIRNYIIEVSFSIKLPAIQTSGMIKP